MNEEEAIVQTDRTPTDPAKALQYAISLIKAEAAKMTAARESYELQAKLLQDQNETIEFTAHEMAELRREWEAEHGKKKIDGWRLLRSWAAKIVGDIDSFSK